MQCSMRVTTSEFTSYAAKDGHPQASVAESTSSSVAMLCEHESAWISLNTQVR